MGYVKHKLGKTFYQTKGSKKNKALIFLHGGPGGASRNTKKLLQLSDIRKVYTYDQIGCGRSSKTGPKYWNIETFVWELSTFIKELDIQEFDLMGSSWGTTLALEYFIRSKGKGVNSLIFQSPMFSTKDWSNDANILIEKLPAKTKKVIKYCHEIGATDSRVYKEAVFEFYKRHVLRDENKLKEKSKKRNLSNPVMYQYMWGDSEFSPTGTLKRYSGLKHLSKINVPTLLICGQYDEARPATVKKYSMQIKQSKFAVVKNASHSIFFEKEKEIVNLLRNFLAKQD